MLLYCVHVGVHYIHSTCTADRRNFDRDKVGPRDPQELHAIVLAWPGFHKVYSILRNNIFPQRCKSDNDGRVDYNTQWQPEH